MSERSVIAAMFVAIATAAYGQAPPAPQPARLANPLAAQPLDGLSATRERPLFSPTRRPPPPPPPPVVRAPEPPPPPPPPNVTLVGILMDGEEARALVRTPSTIMHARIGDEIEGWKVVQIEGRKLVLSRDDRLAEVWMFTGDRSKDTAKSARPADAKGSAAAPPREASHSPPQRSESASQGSRSSGSRSRRRNRQ